MPRTPKEPGAKSGSSGSSFLIPASLFLVFHFFSACLVFASLKKDGFVITTSTPELTEGVISTRVERGGLAVRVAKGDSSNFSFLVLASLE